MLNTILNYLGSLPKRKRNAILIGANVYFAISFIIMSLSKPPSMWLMINIILLIVFILIRLAVLSTDGWWFWGGDDKEDDY